MILMVIHKNNAVYGGNNATANSYGLKITFMHSTHT